MLGDHLGSTNITTDANGAKVSEIRYKPWGEIRYAWTSHPSTTPAYTLPSYTFTGQYSYLDDPSTSGVTEGFGLMFYNARWYDPALGRFAQADTLIPEQSQGTQAWDRYAYVNNAPVRYTDPTGNMRVEEPGSKRGCTDPKYCEHGKPKPYYPNTQLSGAQANGGSQTSTSPRRSFVRAVEEVYNVFNWSVQTPSGMTLYQTPGFPYLSGIRLYADIEVTVENESPMTLGPATISIGQFDVGPENFVFQTGPSTIGALASSFGVNLGDPLAPWGFDVSADYYVTDQSVTTTYTLGVETVARPDNLALITAPIVVYVTRGYIVTVLPKLVQYQPLLNRCYGCQ